MLQNIKNKKVILRCDFNEPLNDDKLLSTRRIDSNLTTIQELLSRDNEIVLLSHHSDKRQKLLPVFKYLKTVLGDKVGYVDSVEQSIITEYFNLNKNIKNKVTLLENTRLFGLGDGDSNSDELCDEGFSKFLATLGECFVFDAFSVAHREHSSTVGVASQLPSYKGLGFIKEEEHLSKILGESKSSLIFMGGAKLSTKMPIINNFLNSGAVVCLGGAMIHPILKSKGVDTKDSYIEEGFDLASAHLDTGHENLILPKGLVWGSDAKEEKNKIVDNIFDFDYIESVFIEKRIKNILWNGPVGIYESGHRAGSQNIYNYIKSKLSKSNTVIGGGDTVTFLEEEAKESGAGNFEQDFSYVSLSGGAMLKYLSGEKFKIIDMLK